MLASLPAVTDERDALLAALARQRDALRILAYGLTDEQAAATPRAGGASVRSLVEQATRKERQWIGLLAPERTWPVLRATWAEHRAVSAESFEAVLRAYAGAAVETAELAGGYDDLSEPIEPGPEPFDDEPWTVRRVLLHLIAETARIVGRAEFVRDAVDGPTDDASRADTAA